MSPIIQPDTTEAVDLSPIEPNTYLAEVMKVDFQTSSKGGAMIVPSFDVTVESGKKPRSRKTFLNISGPGSSGFDQLLRACHLDALADQFKDPAVQPKPQFDTDTLIGQKVQVVIVEDMYQNQKRDKITSFLKA